MIRLATAADIPAIVQMALHFGATPDYAQKIRIDAATVGRLTETLLQNPDALVLVFGEEDQDPTGLLAVLLFPHLMSGELIASEIVWWMEPTRRGEGVQMLREAEAWAREKGAAALQLIAPSDRVGRFYERTGYSWVEASYQKRL